MFGAPTFWTCCRIAGILIVCLAISPFLKDLPIMAAQPTPDLFKRDAIHMFLAGAPGLVLGYVGGKRLRAYAAMGIRPYIAIRILEKFCILLLLIYVSVQIQQTRMTKYPAQTVTTQVKPVASALPIRFLTPPADAPPTGICTHLEFQRNGKIGGGQLRATTFQDCAAEFQVDANVGCGTQMVPGDASSTVYAQQANFGPHSNYEAQPPVGFSVVAALTCP